MDAPLPLHRLDQLPEARPVQRRPSRALKEDPPFSPNGIAAAVTVAGALVASGLVVLITY